MVHDELNSEISKDDEQQHRRTRPGKKENTQENAGQQTIDKRLLDNCPIFIYQVTEGYFSFPGPFNRHNQK
ncbi:unnamed protein product [marine sediment metagenome]|uniref:Uncharacterized protein n=1 Tax=marine sediment metagenome TaxID=412755 RepID=X1NCL7_9ZZZZ